MKENTPWIGHAKWGAACSSCATAKSRCIRSSEIPGAKCNRCRSLQKDCTEQVHKVRKKRVSKPSKTAILEEKLDTLVHFLKATPVESSSQAILTPSSDFINSATKNHHTPVPRTEIADKPRSRERDFILNDFPSRYTSIAPPTCICRVPFNEEDANPADSDENLLYIYMNQLCSCFPFVIIPPGTTPLQLQATRPFLLKVIRLVASLRNVRSMWSQRRAVMQHVSEAVLMNSEHSLDLLQGILVLLGFYHYHCLVHAQFNNLIQLAISMIGDMGLNRDPRLMQKLRVLSIHPEEHQTRTNDERRAIVGIWYMSSNAALTFNKGESARYAKYNDQCLAELEEAAEYESDELLVQLVRIQHLTQKIFEVNNRDQLVDELPNIPNTPMSVYHTAFELELSRLRSSIPANLKNNFEDLIINHYNTTQLRLYERLLNDASLLDTVSQTFTTLSLSDPSTIEKFSQPHSALKTWFEDWLTVPVCSYFYMAQPICAQMIYSMTMLSRWTLLFSCKPQSNYPNFARNQAATAAPISMSVLTAAEAHPIRLSRFSNLNLRLKIQGGVTSTAPDVQMEQIDILGIIDAMATRYEAAKIEMSAAQGGVWKNDIWDLAAKKMRMKKSKILKWMEAVTMADGEGKYQLVDDADSPGVLAVNDNGTWLDQGFGGTQDSWLWATDLFDGMDIDQGVSFDEPTL